MLKEFLLRFNEKFGVPAEQPKVAYRPLESSVSLGHILSFKRRRKVARDNTVQYKNRTLQLLPSRDQPSYAGTHVEVLEQCDGKLLVQYRGVTIPTQEALPRPGLLRAYRSLLPYLPYQERVDNGVNNHQESGLASLETFHVDGDGAYVTKPDGNGSARNSTTSPRRKPTPRQTAREPLNNVIQVTYNSSWGFSETLEPDMGFFRCTQGSP